MKPVYNLPDHSFDSALFEKIAIYNIALCHVIKLEVLGVFVPGIELQLDLVGLCVRHHLTASAGHISTVKDTFALKKGPDANNDADVVFKVRWFFIFTVAQRFFFFLLFMNFVVSLGVQR